MGKYLTNFKTKEEYEAFKAGGSYLTPNVSFIETAGSVINDSYQIQGGSASSWRYFDVSKLDNNAKPMTFPFIIKNSKTGDIRPPVQIDWADIVAIGVDDGNNRVYSSAAGRISWSQAVESMGLTPEVMEQFGMIEITEEEFYNLNA